MKKWFAIFKYPVPTAMEDFLEMQAHDGYFLNYVGQSGLFYYEFTEDKSKKCCYLVDAVQINQGDYVKHLVDDGWEYLGKSGNLLISRKPYDEKRPEKKPNEILRKKHCMRTGLLYLLVGLLFLAVCCFAGYGSYQEITMKPDGMAMRLSMYILEIVVQLPLAVLCFFNAKKCLTYKPVIRRERKMVAEEDSEELDFLK